jgi:hypothetical protein
MPNEYTNHRCLKCNCKIATRKPDSNLPNFGDYCGEICASEHRWQIEPLKTQHQKFIYGLPA